MKVLLILVDGMRPDSITDIPYAQELIGQSASAMDARTVMPSVTLPCHMSLFHSVDPDRHGTTTNVYAPQVRPVNGLCEVLKANKKRSAFFYDWEELRDLTRPNSLAYACFCKGREFGYRYANEVVTDAAIEYLTKNDMDFAFLYLGFTDEAGHAHGWMSKEYLEAMECSWKSIERVMEALKGQEYTVIITADHGGHGRSHGEDIPEDMTIPLIVKGPDFKAGSKLADANIKDIAPTVTKLLGVEPDEEWEGKSLL